MTVPILKSPGGIYLQTASPAMASAVGFAADVSQAVELNQDIRTGMEQAGIYESRASIVARRPGIVFGTTQLKAYLDLMDVTGSYRCINSDGSHPGLDAYQLAHNRCSARDLTDSDRFRVSDGLIVTDSISVTHQGRAEIAAHVEAITDGTNEPIVKAEDITYPNDATDDQEYSLYACDVGGVALTGLKGITIEPGIEIIKEDADGSIWPEWVSVLSQLTRIRLSGINAGWLASGVLPIAGKAVTHANTTLRLVKMASGSSYASLGSSVHITITVAGLACVTTAASATGRGISNTDAMIYCLHDGTNEPLQIDAAAALT